VEKMSHAKLIGLDLSKRVLFDSSTALGAAEPEYRIGLFGEGCLSAASS